jgi:hypothetical protein
MAISRKKSGRHGASAGRFSTFEIRGDCYRARHLLRLIACSLPFAPDDVHEQNHSGEDYFGKPPDKPTDNLRTQLVSRAHDSDYETANKRRNSKPYVGESDRDKNFAGSTHGHMPSPTKSHGLAVRRGIANYG